MNQHKISDFFRLVDHRWYIQEFNATPSMLHVGAMSGLYTTKQVLGYGYSNFIKVYTNDVGQMYYDRDDLHHMADEFMARYRKDRKYLMKVVKTSETDSKPMNDYNEKKIKLLSNLSDEKLIEEYQKYVKFAYDSFGASHLIEGHSLTTDIKMRDMLLKELDKKGLKQMFTEYFTILTQPIRKFFLTDYNHGLNNIINAIKKENLTDIFIEEKSEDIEKKLEKQRKIKKMVDEHCKRFYWINFNFTGGTEMTPKEVISEIKKILSGKDRLEITPLEQFRKNQEKKDALIKELDLPEELVDLIRITDVFTYWQDDRKINIFKGCWGQEKFLEELAKRFNVKVENIRYLMPHETTLENLKNIGEKVLAERRKGCVVIYEEDVTEIYFGKDFEEFKRKLEKKADGEEHKEINGLCASMGKATGRVKICKTMKDIEKFEAGYVLVASMTRPEFVPAMKKAVGVVTDEGGITSHAAVISRELGVPCVIGARIATKILRDGDLVEVNANHAQVRIIERAR
jgi:phosphohistidine swiveling domain-containing protein